jgi:hypothetical protein
MSLDYMFIKSATPVEELESIEDLEQGESIPEDDWLKAAEEFFPGFTFDAGVGSHESGDVTCELGPTEAGLIVYMRGDGDIVASMQTAAVIAAQREIIVLDIQTGQLFTPDAAETSDYQDWYRKTLEGFRRRGSV